MKFKNYLFFGFLLLISMIGLSQNVKADEVLLTDEGVILNLKGLLKMDWDKNDRDVPCFAAGYGEMLFYPENKDIVNGKPLVLRLRNFDYYNLDIDADYEKEAVKTEKTVTEILKKNFPEEYKKMQKIRRGNFEVQSTVKIKKVVPYTECDFTTVYAYATELKRVSGAKSKIIEIKTKKSEDLEEDFIDPDEKFDLKKYEVSSKDGYSNLREKPTKDSKIVLKMDNGTVVKYITKSGDWYYIHYADYPSENEKEWKVKEYRGFIHKSQLKKYVE